MAGTMTGADVEQLRQLARRFNAHSTTLKSMSAQLTARIQNTQAWQGNDAQRFRSEWSSQYRVKMVQAAESLTQAAEALNRNAQQQQQASAAGGSGSGGGAGTGTGSSLGDLVRGILGGGAFATGAAAVRLWGIFNRAKGLATFLGKLKAGEKVSDAVKWFTREMKPVGKIKSLLAKVPGLSFLGKETGFISRLMGRAFLPLTAVTGLVDAFTGGGYSGARGWATRGFGLAGAVGAVGLMASAGWLGAGAAGLIAATGPIGLAVAGGAVLAYGAWTLGNFAWDHREAIGHFFKGVGEWTGNVAKNAYEGAKNVVSNVGKGVVNGVKHLIPHISIL